IPAVWIDIFKQNKDNLTDVLNHFQAQIEWFKGMIETERYEELSESVTKIVSFKEKLENGSLRKGGGEYRAHENITM
ncbi:MAG TPA: prephenate dehydrogenase/arogenate dehydrogenase family protein, partial [Fervidobacterium sp.]|nr:prephenate dehydrogenase/arogenate dehydrogenase family protein [Fervidobacterium sp.]